MAWIKYGWVCKKYITNFLSIELLGGHRLRDRSFISVPQAIICKNISKMNRESYIFSSLIKPIRLDLDHKEDQRSRKIHSAKLEAI